MKDLGLILLSRTLSLKLTKACLKHKMLCIFLCRDERPILVIRLLKVKTFIVSWMQFSMFPILWDFYDYIALQFHTKTLFLISFSTTKPQENSNCRINADFEAEDRCHVLYFFRLYKALNSRSWSTPKLLWFIRKFMDVSLQPRTKMGKKREFNSKGF